MTGLLIIIIACVLYYLLNKIDDLRNDFNKLLEEERRIRAEYDDLLEKLIMNHVTNWNIHNRDV